MASIGMKAVVVEKSGFAVVREVERPEPAPGQILIRLEKCLLCTWEQRIFSGNSMKLPYIPGHEAVGRVAEVPAHTVTSFQVGDPVAIKTLNHCGHCEDCYRGNDNQCTGSFQARVYSGIPAAGGLAQYIAMEVSRVFPLSTEKISMTEAAFSEPLACCVRSLERANIALSEDVVIVGAGIMGQLHNLLAKRRGGRTIIAEPDSARRKLARKLGADIVFDPIKHPPEAYIKKLTQGRGAHVIFVTTALPQLAELYIGALAKMGRLVYYGSFHPDENIALNPNQIHYSEKCITGSYSPNVEGFWASTRLLSQRIVDVRPLISGEFSMQDCQKAFELALDPRSYRVAIDLS